MKFQMALCLLYPTQRATEGIMFLTHPSVGQSVSSLVLYFFFVSAAPQNLVKFYSYEVHETSRFVIYGTTLNEPAVG